MVTWNIHKGIGGVDRRYRPDRIIAVLKSVGADLMLLQEVDEGAPRSRHHRQVDLIGDALEMPHRAYFPNVYLKAGVYGNALLSRFPLDHRENIDLSRPFRKRRGALHARLTVPAGSRRHRVWLYNVHLGLAEAERRQQLRRLVLWHREHRVHEDTSVIIAGDLNDVWGRIGPVILEPAGFRGLAVRDPTFPAMRPIRSLDGVFIGGPVRFTRWQAYARPPAREASDHLPLAVTLKIG